MVIQKMKNSMENRNQKMVKKEELRYFPFSNFLTIFYFLYYYFPAWQYGVSIALVKNFFKQKARLAEQKINNALQAEFTDCKAR